jgi:hypothetical protein
MEDNNIESFDAQSCQKDDLLKRKRKKSNYKKINNETRQKLIEMVTFYLNRRFI